MGEGKPQGEARDHVAQTAVQTNDNWQTGTPKDPSDGEKREYWAQQGDANAAAGQTTSQAQQVSSTLDPRPEAQGGDAINPASFGGLKDGLPASGAAADPDQTVDADEKI